MEPIKVLDARLKAMDKGYEAYESPDGDLFITYCEDDFFARIAITIDSRIYLHPLGVDFFPLLVLISKYIDDSGKDMSICVK